MFVPKLVTTLRDYSFADFLNDAKAGIIVGIVALPLSIAFGIASGVSPERGLVTAIIAGFLISALGGSRVQIGGPTGAFIVVIYGVVEKFGVDGLIVTTFLAGIVLIIMGAAKLGSVIKFIPAPVITGFTSGIAVIIFSSQIKDFLGLTMTSVPAEFFSKWQAYFAHLDTANPESIGIGLFSILVLIFWPKVSTKIPAPFVAVIVATIAVKALHLDVETIASRFGEVPSTFPTPVVPHVTLDMIRSLMPSVLTVAVLAAVESLLSAVVADGMIGGRHRSNMELVAQGVANVVSPIFGGIPATGAIARTATNIKNGGRTPVAGIVHALTLLLIMLVFGSYASLIPMPTLAAILIIVAYNMSEWHTFVALLKAPKSDVLVLVTTFILTVVVDLTVAIEVGMVLAAFLFMKQMASVTNVQIVNRDLDDRGEEPEQKREVNQAIQIYEINGPFFFGAVSRFTESIGVTEKFPRVIILRMRDVPAIDATGMKAIEDLYRKVEHKRSVFLIAELHSQPYLALERSGFLSRMGKERLYSSLEDALTYANKSLNSKDVGDT